MQIANEFPLDLPLERAWPLLTDLERVAPAMPGVTVEGADGDDLKATMRVKVGPITVSYRTVVTLVSADETSHTAVLRAKGRELRGRGTVDATVTARLAAGASSASSTVVALTTDLAVTGRVAQFGGGVMAEVADRLLRQFATRLVAELEAPAGAASGAGAGSGATTASSEASAGAAGSGAGAGGDATTASSEASAGAAGSGAGGTAGAGPASATGAGSGVQSGPTADEAYSGAGAAAAGSNGHAPGAAATRAAAPKEAEPVDLGSIAGAALLPGGSAVGAFLGAFLGTFLGALAAAVLLRSCRKR